MKSLALLVLADLLKMGLTAKTSNTPPMLQAPLLEGVMIQISLTLVLSGKNDLELPQDLWNDQMWFGDAIDKPYQEAYGNGVFVIYFEVATGNSIQFHQCNCEIWTPALVPMIVFEVVQPNALFSKRYLVSIPNLLRYLCLLK